MGRVFLSYAREDRKCAETLADVLENAGHSVWWDSQIDGGEEFSAEIEAALDDADVVLVAWSRNAVKSRWVRDEAGVGCDTGRLVPVSVDGTPPPMGFRQFHTIDMNGWKAAASDGRTKELLRAIDHRLGNDSGATVSVRDGGKPTFKRPPRKLIIGIAVVLVLITLATAFVYLRHPSENLTRPTIALLPFTSSSTDPALNSLAIQARGAAAHSLTDTGVLVTLLDKPPASGSDADYLLSGEIGGTQQKASATLHLADARHGTTVWSSKFHAEGTDVANLAERIGAQTAGTLGWAFPLRTLGRGKRADPELTAQLMRVIDQNTEPLEGYQISKGLVARWPDSGTAQLSLAFNTAFVLGQIPRDQRPTAVATARQAATRAEKQLSDFGDAYVPLCLLQPETRFGDCEDRLRKAIRKDPDAPFVDTFLARFMDDVGRSEEAFELARLSYSHDRYMPEKIAFMIRMMEVTGDDPGAKALFQQGYLWWPESGLLQSRLSGYIERGDFDAIVRLRDEMGATYPAEYAAIAEVARAARSKSASSLQKPCQQANAHWLVPAECMLAYAKLGHLDEAYELAKVLYPNRVGRSAADEQRLWLNDPDSMPAVFLTSAGAAPLRTDPRYLGVAERTGLLRYWRSGRLPDFCTKRNEPVCAKIRNSGR